MFRKKPQTQGGFTLIEAMVATVVISIGFIGSYTLVAYTRDATNSALVRQKLQMQANQILDLLEADIANIDSYNNMTLTTCTAPGSGVTTTSVVRRYEWCMRLADEAKAAQAGDHRAITVTTSGGKKIVQVLLESGNGTMQVVMKRMYEP